MAERVAICIPTVTGREESFQRAVEAYGATSGSEHDIYVIHVKDEPTWGAGIEACMQQISELEPLPTIVHFSADDLVPQEGWLETAIETVRAGHCPAPVLETDGVIHYGHPPTPDMTDGKATATSVVPTIRIEWWDFIAPMFVAHYFTDDYISLKLRMNGVETLGRTGYRFEHHHESAARGAGMSQDARMAYDGELFQRFQRTGQLPSRGDQIGRPAE